LRGKETMASKIALSIENILQKKADPIHMKWMGNNGIDMQKYTEPVHENLPSDWFSNILEDNDYQDIKNLTDRDSTPQEKTPTNEHEATRFSNRVRKIPASRYSDFLWEN
jgi:hypothetical protein